MLLLLGFPLTSNGQSEINLKDSVDIKTQIEGFYAWYFEMIKDQRLSDDFNPQFVEQKNGMTELDFKDYTGGLRKYKFSEDFIQRKIGEFKQCNDNLGKIPFGKFSNFEDLDDFETINCDFNNSYEWTGGMEPKESARLTSLIFVDSQKIIGHIDFTSYSLPDSKATVTFKRMGEEWRIDNLELER